MLLAADAGGVNWTLIWIAGGFLVIGSAVLAAIYGRRRSMDRNARASVGPAAARGATVRHPSDDPDTDLRGAYDAAFVSGDFEEAARIAKKLRDEERYAEALERGGESDRAVTVWVDLGHFHRAAELLMRFNKPARAAKMYLQAGDLPKAIQAYVAADDLDKAAEVYRQQGDEQNAHLLDAQHLSKRGEHLAAARHYVAAGMMLEAAGQLLEAGDIPKAVEAFRRAGRSDEAAVLLERHGEMAPAARLHEESENWLEAARCYAAAGDEEGRVRCLARGGRGYQAGRLAFERGELQDALEFFESIPRVSDDYVNACLFRGQIYERNGRLVEAADAYGAFLAARAPDAKNKLLFLRVAQLQEGAGRTKAALNSLGRLLTAGLATPDVTAWAKRLEGQAAHQERTIMQAPEPERRTPLDQPTQARRASTLPPQLQEDEDTPPPAIAILERRYRFADKLGQGGNGVVYKAVDRALGRSVVVKFLHQALLPTEVARKYFLREAKTAARLHHPNIVTIFDIGEEEETLYYSMELVEGRTLADIILDAGGRLSHSELLPIVTQLCAALEYAHEHQVIHRDIKPGNVMVTDEEVVKLLDFGLAKALDENPDKSVFLCGTPFYMSPEQIQRDFLDHRTDIYSLGCLLYVCYTGDVPFPEGNIFYHHQHSPPPAPEVLAPDLPPGVADVLRRAVAKDREERYQTAGELARALQACG